jgi:hypothetical protein
LMIWRLVWRVGRWPRNACNGCRITMRQPRQLPYERAHEHGDLFQMTKCRHGVESVRDTSGSDIALASQMSTCTCCGSMFPYIDEDMDAQYEELDRVWEPRDRCEKCGGHYVRRHFGSVEFS